MPDVCASASQAAALCRSTHDLPGGVSSSCDAGCEWHAACDCADMDIVSNVAASRLVAQQRAMDVIARQHRQRQHAGFKAERVQFSDWLSRQTRHRRAAGDRSIAYTQDRATWREQQRRHADPHRQSVRPRHHQRRLFHRQHGGGPRLTRDGRFGLMPDGTLADSAGNAVLDTNGQPIKLSPDRHADHHRRRRHGVQRERPARQDRRGATDRSDAARGRGRHAVPRRCAHQRRWPRPALCRARSRTPTSSRCWK